MLLLVDGSNLLFQMFYGMPARIFNEKGKPVHGTLGFVGALLKIIRMVEPTHVAVFFDGENGGQRRELDENYKANRPDFSQMPQEDTPFSQLPDIYAALDYLGICHAESDGCEADDILAGYALGDHGPMVIASQDSDLFQLIGENVRILRYRGDKTVICDRAYIREKLGIEPEQYADFKALVGDNSDNIPGVDKIGPKTAAALLAQFGTLENILAHGAGIDKPSIRASILENGHRARKNYALIRLSPMEALPFGPAQMAFTDRGWTTTQVLKAVGAR